MPELPDVTVYRERMAALLVGEPLEQVRLWRPFLLRTVEPALETAHGREVVGVERLGKRLVTELEGELFLVLHLMIAGRLRWHGDADRNKQQGGRNGQCAFDFPAGSLVLTEASSKKRAALHVVQGRAGLAEFDRGGLEVLGATPEEFRAALQRENRTLKRALTDPRLFSGIGNAYSDEILWAARLTPVKLTSRLSDDEIQRLHRAAIDTLEHWTRVLREEVGDGFPDKVTAFREGMAVHGRYRQPCPECGRPVQRIRYADNEANYCAQCQNTGVLLADRGLSQLMRKDWPRTLDELEERRRPG